MLFSSKNKTEKNNISQQPTPLRKALRFAFNPEIGAVVQPLQESHDMFVQLLAMIFISQNMFPADHPAYLGANGERLTLRLLLATVRHNLTFSKENMPKVLLYCAVVGSLGFAGLMVVALIASLFIGKAHAAGYFTPPDGDIAQSWINFLFNGGGSSVSLFSFFAHSDLFKFSTMDQAGAIQSALITALGFYSNAILIVAASLLFYHLVAMTVETAHHGVVMGKEANQIWAPIRLVVAIGLLVPVGGGLNSGQFIVIRVAEWGSGLASNVWGIFLTSLPMSTGVAGVPPFEPAVAYNAVLTAVCADAYNSHDKNLDGKVQNQMGDDSANQGQFNSSSKSQPSKVDPYNARVCGQNTFSPAPSGSSALAGLGGTATECYQELQQTMQQFAQQQNKNFKPKDADGSGSNPSKYDGSVENALSSYYSCLMSGLPVPNLVFLLSANMGWVSAGAALSSVAQAQADANNLDSLIPDTHGPDFSEGGDTLMRTQVAPNVAKFARWIGMLGSGGGGGGGSFGTDACAGDRGGLMQAYFGMQQQGEVKGHYLDRVLQLIDWFASWNCVWTSGGVVGIHIAGDNPLSEMAQLGQAMINTAYDSFDMFVNLSADGGHALASKKAGIPAVGGELSAKGQLPIEGKQGALQAIGAILSMITSIFFVSGIMLAYYLPMIPFITFLFGVLTWVVALLEAVVGIPLIALAHLNPKGDGLPGPSAKQAYYYVFSLMLRPVMMVFGLIAGLLTFYIAVDYMNEFYGMAVATSGGVAGGRFLLSRMVYSAMYVMILYVCANSCFKTINFLPEHAVRWMGGTPLHYQHMGDAAQVAGMLQSGASQAISGANQAIQSGGWGAAQELRKGNFGKVVQDMRHEKPK